MKFTDKLKELREGHGLTQRQVAAALNIDVAMYNRFEKGERNMKREVVGKISLLYNYPIEELIKYWNAGRVYALIAEEEMASEVIGLVAEDLMNSYSPSK